MRVIFKRERRETRELLVIFKYLTIFRPQTHYQGTCFEEFHSPCLDCLKGWGRGGGLLQSFGTKEWAKATDGRRGLPEQHNFNFNDLRQC